MSDVTIYDNQGESRYEAHVDGRLAGFAEYRREGDVVVMPHTEVLDEFSGRGIAGKLARHALDDMAAESLSVRPDCSFIRGWLEKHPEHPVKVV